MFQKRWTAIAAGVALAGALGAVGSAQAAIYRGSWDPAYGAPFDSLGWEGTATYFVPQSCVAVNGTCTDSGIKVLTASVSFYDIADPGHSVLQTLNFNASPDVTIYGVTISDQKLTGIDTGFFAPIKGDIPEAKYNGNDYYFHLVFHGSQVQLFYTNTAAISPACASGGFGGPTLGVCGYSAQTPDVVFAPVPEPTTWALLFAGLGVIGVTARRRNDRR